MQRAPEVPVDMMISFPGGKKVDATFNGFRIQTDQSVRGGGEASAPEPFDLFLASIGTCAGIFVLGFCQARNLPTAGVRLVQRATHNAETKRLEQVAIEIHVPEGFPAQYRDALVRVADQCKVKKTILQPPAFHVATVVDSESAVSVQ